ncbi:hypothetical protein CEXT_195041 [Caerostris extrusa]|uniref:Uncharacterized protein n=1 Tax=Caerostris extrusa TaxID=172846 RepID=A0AAV4M6L0_CAEEX|nr:hypothetical protein CEXT_195041 [Caerostris extrusa]
MGTLFHSHKIPRNFSRKETPYPPPTNSLKTGPSNPPRSDGGGGAVLREQWEREGGRNLINRNEGVAGPSGEEPD